MLPWSPFTNQPPPPATSQQTAATQTDDPEQHFTTRKSHPPPPTLQPPQLDLHALANLQLTRFETLLKDLQTLQRKHNIPSTARLPKLRTSLGGEYHLCQNTLEQLKERYNKSGVTVSEGFLEEITEGLESVKITIEALENPVVSECECTRNWYRTAEPELEMGHKEPGGVVEVVSEVAVEMGRGDVRDLVGGAAGRGSAER